MDNKKNRNVQGESNETPRRTFSVSKEFECILEEIDNMPNKSRFICEAILEKLERTKNPGKEVAEALNSFLQIQSLISQPIKNFQSYMNVGERISMPDINSDFEDTRQEVVMDYVKSKYGKKSVSRTTPSPQNSMTENYQERKDKQESSPLSPHSLEELASSKEETKEERTVPSTMVESSFKETEEEIVSSKNPNQAQAEEVSNQEQATSKQNLSEIEKAKQKAMKKYFSRSLFDE